MIPKEIKREHILKAIKEMDKIRRRKSTGYDLVYKGKLYPPKYLVSLAAFYALGKELHPNDFSSGRETFDFLNELGFEIIPKVDISKNDQKFSNWAKWRDRNDIVQIQLPGVYALALSDVDISTVSFSWCPEIIYIGMTNSKGGLKSRLQQFDNTIKGRDEHGGAERVRFKYSDYEKLSKKLYVSVCPHECDVESNDPLNLRIMGNVEKFEYECFALFVEAFGELPEFNNKKKSPKK